MHEPLGGMDSPWGVLRIQHEVLGEKKEHWDGRTIGQFEHGGGRTMGGSLLGVDGLTE